MFLIEAGCLSRHLSRRLLALALQALNLLVQGPQPKIFIHFTLYEFTALFLQLLNPLLLYLGPLIVRLYLLLHVIPDLLLEPLIIPHIIQLLLNTGVVRQCCRLFGIVLVEPELLVAQLHLKFVDVGDQRL